MQLKSPELDDYVADLALLAERYGITLDLAPDEALAVEIERDGALRFNLTGVLPDGRRPSAAVVQVGEKWRPVENDRYERSAYRYELIDVGRNFRRGFHRHDDGAFERRFGVVVHEHCESPIGDAPCAVFLGPPVRDGYRAIVLLVSTWLADTPDCAALPCLEPL